MKVKYKILGIILIGIVLMLGCSKGDISTDNVVTISPGKLFEGNTKKIEPHLGFLNTTCITLKYTGEKKKIKCNYEIWENGELTNSNSIISKVIRNKFDGEVSISLKELINNDLQRSDNLIMTTVISDENGYIKSTKYIDRFNDDYSSGPFNINESIKTDDKEEIPIWVYLAGGGDFYVEYDNMEETAKELEWALLVKVEFTN